MNRGSGIIAGLKGRVDRAIAFVRRIHASPVHMHERFPNRRSESDRSQHTEPRSAPVIAPPELVDHPVELEVVVRNWILRGDWEADLLRRLAYSVAEADDVEAVRQFADELQFPPGAAHPGVFASFVPVNKADQQARTRDFWSGAGI